MLEKELAQAFDKIQEKSSARNLIIGRLGRYDGNVDDIDVVGRPGYVVVSMGSEGDQGVTIAKDKAGAAKIVFQEVRMRRELGELVIREASAYAGGSGGGGGGGALDDLSDVTLFTLTNGEVLTYSSSLGKWTNSASGGAGSTYSAGNGLALTGSVFSVKPKPNEGIGADSLGTFVSLQSGGAIGSGSGGIFVVPKTTGGLATDASGLFIVPKADGGLATDAGGVYVVTDPARSITSGAAGIGVLPRPNYGLFNNAAGLGVLKPATSGLVLDSTGLYVGAGNGLEIAANETRVKRDTNSGLTFGGSGGLALGTPADASVTSTNAVSGTTHSHDVLTSSDVGTTPAASILASNASGQLTLAQLTIYGNLLFAGGARSITGSNNITIAPTTDLILDPGGNVELPIAQQVITSTYNDFVSNITGYRNWDTGGNLRQISISKIKADELFVRFFTADEVRVNRGEEFWGRSYGIVESEFTLPAIGVNSDVWFEEAPDLGSAKLFLPDNWLLARQIDITTSLVVMAIWFRVIDAGANDYVTRQDAVEGSAGVSGTPPRQQWRIQRRSGGVTGEVIRKGNVIVDFGKPYDDAVYPDTTPVQGQGIVHLSALAQDGGPFIQIATFDHITSDVPQFKNRVRMGHLSGYAGIPNDVWGFGAGNDGSLTPTSGFSGLIARHDSGLSLYNTSLLLYNGSTLEASLSQDYGLRFLQDTGQLVNDKRYISWHSTLSSVTAPISSIASYDLTNERRIDILVEASGASQSSGAILGANQDTPFAAPFVEVTSGLQETSEAGGLIRLFAKNTYVWGKLKVGDNATPIAVSPLHVYENTANTGTNAGVTIEQDGDGDARLNWVLTGGVTFSMGIDNTDNLLKISHSTTLGTNDIFRADSTGTILRAGGAGGMYLQDDGGNLGIAIEDGGNNVVIGSTGHVEPYTGFDAQNNRMVIVRYPTAHSVDTPLTGFIFSNNQTDGTDGAVALLTFMNEAIAGADKRLAIIANYTDTTTGEGQLRFYVFDDGVANAALNIRASGRIGIGTTTPGVDVIGTTDYLPAQLLHIASATNAGLLVSGGSGGAALNLLDTSTTANQKWFRITKSGLYTSFQHITDSGTTIGPRLTLGSLSTEGIGFVGLPESGTALLVEASNMRGVVVENYGTAAAHFLGRRANGTATSPTMLNSGNTVLTLMAVGYHNGGAYHTVQNAEISVRTTEAYTSSSTGGAEITFFTRNNGAGSVTEKVKIQHDGGLYVPYIWNTAVAGTAVHVNSNGILTKTTSSLRHKREISELDGAYGDRFILAMRPVSYTPTNGENKGRQIGLIAEEIQAIGGGLGEPFISRNDSGLVESLHYDRLVSPIVLTLQGLLKEREAGARRIEALEQRIITLERKLAA